MPESIPGFPPIGPSEQQPAFAESAGVMAAFANAKSKWEQAHGEASYLWKPQVALVAEYSRFSNLFNNYSTYYPAFANNTLNAGVDWSTDSSAVLRPGSSGQSA